MSVVEIVKLDPATLEPSDTGVEYRKTTFDNGMVEIAINTPTPPPTLADIKAAKLTELQAARDAAIYSSFTSSALGTDKTYNYDREAYDNFRGEATLLSLDTTITTISWATLEDGFIDHTRDQFIQVIKDGGAHEKSLKMQYYGLEAQVQAATTSADVSAIVWP